MTKLAMLWLIGCGSGSGMTRYHISDGFPPDDTALTPSAPSPISPGGTSDIDPVAHTGALGGTPEPEQPLDTGGVETGEAETGVAGTGVVDTGVAGTVVVETGRVDTAVAHTGVVGDTASADTASGGNGHGHAHGHDD